MPRKETIEEIMKMKPITRDQAKDEIDYKIHGKRILFLQKLAPIMADFGITDFDYVIGPESDKEILVIEGHKRNCTWDSLWCVYIELFMYLSIRHNLGYDIDIDEARKKWFGKDDWR